MTISWADLESAAKDLNRSLRTVYRMVARGDLVRGTGSDGRPVYTLVADTPDTDSPDDVSGIDMTMTRESGPADPPPAPRPRGRPQGTAPTVDPTIAQAAREAKLRTLLHDHAGVALAALLDAAAALDGLVELVEDQLAVEGILSVADVVENDPAAYGSWRAILNSLNRCRDGVRGLLDRRSADDSVISRVALDLAGVERRWARARAALADAAPYPDAASAVRRRTDREKAVFEAAGAALRSALIA